MGSNAMDYEAFCSMAASGVRGRLGGRYDVRLQDVTKNNNVRLKGLAIKEGTSNVCPNIYLESYYKKYQEGMGTDAVIRDIIAVYEKNRISGNVDIGFFTDWKRASERVIFKLVNFERNRELLTDVPHRRYLDLALVFCCIAEGGGQGYASVLVRSSHLAYWGITEEELYENAWRNTPRLLEYEFSGLGDIICGILAENGGQDGMLGTERMGMGGIPEPDVMEKCGIFVLTNRQRINGAACMLYDGVLKDIAEQLDSDLYILPSSTHEVLILPAIGDNSDAELSEMVKDVNATQLAEEEILSDHVYRFRRDTGEMTM